MLESQPCLVLLSLCIIVAGVILLMLAISLAREGKVDRHTFQSRGHAVFFTLYLETSLMRGRQPQSTADTNTYIYGASE